MPNFLDSMNALHNLSDGHLTFGAGVASQDPTAAAAMATHIKARDMERTRRQDHEDAQNTRRSHAQMKSHCCTMSFPQPILHFKQSSTLTKEQIENRLWGEI
jgi:hypothetical protein